MPMKEQTSAKDSVKNDYSLLKVIKNKEEWKSMK